MSSQLARLNSRLREQQLAAVRASLPLERLLLRPGQLEEARDLDLDDSGWTPVAAGAQWGGADAWTWFRVWFRVPASWAGERARLSLPLGGQGMSYLDGKPWQGLDERHQAITLPREYLDGKPHLAAVEAYAVPNTTIARKPTDTCTVGQCRIEMIDAEAEAFFYDLAVGVETVAVLPEALAERNALLNLLLGAENMVDRLDPGSEAFRQSVARARTHLARGLEALAAAGSAGRPRILGVGHAHIDTAWLWPIAQTRRKVARSWSTVLRLMERFPHYHFLCSQPQQYKWLEEDEPDLYAQVAKRIAEGRWEPAAATWVEPDTNLPSGESLVRQFLYGQTYLRDHFGRQTGILWLPDAFGFSGALPQLMRSAGVHSFVTIKLSWNDTNRMPHDTFRWRGIDGTEVLAYFMTAGEDWQPVDFMADPFPVKRRAANYNANFSIKELFGGWVRYRDKLLNTETLYSFGYGDGGGGPTESMLEYADRLHSYPGLPSVTQGSAERFLQGLGDRLLPDPRTPTWEGELYLEYHRGTYTSQGRAKWDNRRAEHLLHDAELWCAWTQQLGQAQPDWRDRLARCWQDVLLNQFHDILPGSSIGEVYQDQRRQLAAALAEAGGVLAEAQETLVASLWHHTQTTAASGSAGILPVPGSPESSLHRPGTAPVSSAPIPPPPTGSAGAPPAPVDARVAVSSIAVFNGSPFARTETSELRLPPGTPDRTTLLTIGGQSLQLQPVTAAGGTVLVSGLTIPPLGFAFLNLGTADAAQGPTDLVVSERVLENRFFKLELDSHGRFSSLLDKRYHREVLAPGGGNQLLAFEDKPISFDAWDIDDYYTEKATEIVDVQSWKVVESGPVRGGVEITRAFGTSIIRQRILIHVDTPRIDIQTQLDWHQRQVLLKAAFPLAIHAAQATYECAFGFVQRPTHRNTSWDAARFEVPGHRWADLSEAGYGASLLNDGKYGYDCLGNVLRLTLLKSAIQPDPLADEGSHSFAYALYPHGPDWHIEDTVKAAIAFNMPVYARPVAAGDTPLPEAASLVESDSAHAMVDTVKVAENGQGIIVRVYDCANQRGPVCLTFAHPIASAVPVNILEEGRDQAATPAVDGNRLSFTLLPFQVRSFRVVLRS